MFQVLVGTAVVENGKVLLVKEKKANVAGLLNLPAGHLEAGENLIEGAKRELKEETGFDSEIDTLIDFERFEARGDSYLWFIFSAKIDHKTAQKNELDFDFYDIDYIKKYPELLRDQRVLPRIIDRLTKKRTLKNILCEQ